MGISPAFRPYQNNTYLTVWSDSDIKSVAKSTPVGANEVRGFSPWGCTDLVKYSLIRRLHHTEIDRIKEFLEKMNMEQEDKEAFVEGLVDIKSIKEVVGKAKNTGNDIYSTINVFMEDGGDIHILTNMRTGRDYYDAIFNEEEYRKFMDGAGTGLDGINRKILLKIARQYEERKREMEVVDFDDILVLIVKRLKEMEGTRQFLDDRFKRFVVDEFQDVNYIQFEFLRLLNQDYNYLTVVGDSDQAIYSFRGCDKRYFEDFGKTFGNVTEFVLTNNYRSKSRIIDVANASIRNNTNRYDRVMKSVTDASGQVKMINAYDYIDEEKKILSVLSSIPQEQYHEVCFLSRNNRHSKRYQSMLVKHRIPFVVYGGTGFFDKKAVKDILSLLRIVNNPKDMTSLGRILMLLPKVGAKSAEKLCNSLPSGHYLYGRTKMVPKSERYLP